MFPSLDFTPVVEGDSPVGQLDAGKDESGDGSTNSLNLESGASLDSSVSWEHAGVGVNASLHSVPGAGDSSAFAIASANCKKYIMNVINRET